ncbi:hypothetical protein FNV43_RR21080 [Rhamnella rubrinervis]|uniref:CASP-like protein n=1 Tax=Rhamnella rubrinervis TaxID=2594499 RepID=A0A8K0E1K7_9ROSA|nr:hypothetical protein FNV43_RR21080 [Rhamnella rubrinervis]
MDTKVVAYTTLVLRIIDILSLIASVVLLVLNNSTLSDGTKTSFKDFHAYWFVLATAVLGAAYSIVQLTFDIYYACTEKRLIRHERLPQFDFYADEIMSLILASGVGAGYGMSLEFKRFINQVFDALEALGDCDLSEARSKGQDFFNKGIFVTSLLLLGCLCMTMVSVFSSINKREATRGFFK